LVILGLLFLEEELDLKGTGVEDEADIIMIQDAHVLLRFEVGFLHAFTQMIESGSRSDV